MGFVQWKDEYSVGVELFDEHHRKLVDIINELQQAIETGQARPRLGMIFGKLIEYTQIHFTVEETQMELHAYPGLKAQKKEHTLFVDKIKKMRQQYLDGEKSMDADVMVFLKNWLINHILHSDMEYKTFFAEKGIK